VFIFVKNYITFAELWFDEVYEMIAIEVKSKDRKIKWEIVGIYSAPKEDMRLLENLADQTGYMGRITKRCIIGGYLKLPYVDCNGQA